MNDSLARPAAILNGYGAAKVHEVAQKIPIYGVSQSVRWTDLNILSALR